MKNLWKENRQLTSGVKLLFPNTMEYLFIRILGNHLNYNAEKIKLLYMIV